MKLTRLFAAGLLAIVTLTPRPAAALQAAAPAPTQEKTQIRKGTPTTAEAAPTAQEITEAKSKGLVWVNLNTHVYHKDGPFYGNTRHGKFMTEDEATKAGNRAARESGTKNKTARN